MPCSVAAIRQNAGPSDAHPHSGEVRLLCNAFGAKYQTSKLPVTRRRFKSRDDIRRRNYGIHQIRVNPCSPCVPCPMIRFPIQNWTRNSRKARTGGQSQGKTGRSAHPTRVARWPCEEASSGRRIRASVLNAPTDANPMQPRRMGTLPVQEPSFGTPKRGVPSFGVP